MNQPRSSRWLLECIAAVDPKHGANLERVEVDGGNRLRVTLRAGLSAEKIADEVARRVVSAIKAKFATELDGVTVVTADGAVKGAQAIAVLRQMGTRIIRSLIVQLALTATDARRRPVLKTRPSVAATGDAKRRAKGQKRQTG